MFDPKTVADLADFEDANRSAVGIAAVIVNGVPNVRDGALIPEAAPGEVIRREVN